MADFQYTWIYMSYNGMVDNVISVEEDCYHFTVRDCPDRIFCLERIEWCNGWCLSMKADCINRKWQHLFATAGDSSLTIKEQLRMLDIIIRTIRATIRTETVETAEACCSDRL